MHAEKTPSTKSIQFVIEIKTQRKAHGGLGRERNGHSGKKGKIINKETGEILYEESGSTFADLSKKLRATGLIPAHVTINKAGQTVFFSASNRLIPTPPPGGVSYFTASNF